VLADRASNSLDTVVGGNGVSSVTNLAQRIEPDFHTVSARFCSPAYAEVNAKRGGGASKRTHHPFRTRHANQAVLRPLTAMDDPTERLVMESPKPVQRIYATPHFTVNSGLVPITVILFDLRVVPKAGRVLAANIAA
jgi:hypothetical protein